MNTLLISHIRCFCCFPTKRARLELGAGDVALYDGRCLHAGDANTSPRQRVLFYCSFATAEHARTSTRGTILDDLRGKHALSDWREWTWSSSED